MVPAGTRLVVEFAVAVIGVGLDVVEVTRARALLDRHRSRILDRTLTDRERAYVDSLGDQAPAFAAAWPPRRPS